MRSGGETADPAVPGVGRGAFGFRGAVPAMAFGLEGIRDRVRWGSEGNRVGNYRGARRNGTPQAYTLDSQL